MTKLHLYITLFWIAFGIFVAAYSYGIGLGKLLDPGPGLFPFILSIAVVLLSACKLGNSFTSIKKDKKELIQEKKETLFENPFNTMIFVLVLLVYAFLLEPLGFLIASFFTMVVLLRVAGYIQWVRIILYAMIISIISYTGFTFLGTQLPSGILGLGLR